MGDLSATESALYDRQIRLWGLSSQSAIKEATTLVVGLSPVTLEICKNLILAGSNITLLTLTESMDFNNFLTSLEGVESQGSPYERTAEALKGLNPLAQVNIVHSYPSEEIQVAIVSLNQVEIAKTIDMIPSRNNGGPILIAIAESESGIWSYTDCNKHVVEGVNKGEPVRLPAIVHTPTLLEILNNFKASEKLNKKEPVIGQEALLWLQNKNHGNLKSTGFHPAPAFAPLAAIAGGLLAQECIKFFTKKDIPLLNSISVDAEACGAFVKALGGARTEFLGKIDDDVKIVSGGLVVSNEIDLD